jgi:Fe2+ transport system protein FeoA
MQSVTVPLSSAPVGRRLRIVSLAAGLGLQQHLADLGLGLGCEIEVIQHGAPGPFLVAVKETRVAIGVGMACKIIVSVE